ncbi:alpha-L-fucosidase [Microbacterium nymphoidis]|uniref:alpha-L-fucosidase n=1 Tax=Microbacterium nymphoidis TaxID=2898586 RepID=UPI001E322111|nr:alpha-L-fucosidase [Microbacterium nymphoidis]MCD2497081.1 alpha-L-fucosidase [Microbacterium nymphoidis]
MTTGSPQHDVDIPRPTAAQLRWQRAGSGVFFHFGVNTFGDREWSDGTLPAASFVPEQLDVGQWLDAAQLAGARYVVLTAKHHDGFCLWPTSTTDYSVASSPWRGGAGDVVGELANACRERGVGFGVYLSPWDRHAPEYADPDRYDDLYAAQLTELLTGYGDLVEVWFDGAGSEGRTYDWPRFMRLVAEHQPEAMVFNMGAPTIRWVGNEDGLATDPVKYVADAVPLSQYVAGEAPLAVPRYLPPECDVSIRRGWFWHPDESPKSVAHLLAIHQASVQLGANLLLNLPPDRSGRIDAADLARLAEYRAELDLRFGRPVPARLHHRGDGVWEAELAESVAIGHVELRERLEEGQRVLHHRITVAGEVLASGHTIGVRRVHRVPVCETRTLTVTLTGGGELEAVVVHPAADTRAEPMLPPDYAASREVPDH